MTPKERYKKLKQHLSEESPVLLDVIKQYEQLDKTAHALGFLEPEQSFTEKISWWPLISVLGTFSAGKSTFINSYLGVKVQESGNQAVDDKFTVITYGNDEKPMTLPGLALDADPRFPFYNISEEVEKVEKGEGNRVNLYLQLKTVKSDAIKGEILIDSPGFDADSQRDAVLRITDHIIDMSDLVLIFFDARHPEPGAMRDTLKHLVGATMGQRDSDKILYILNQIDTTAKEDNLEEVMGAWQRALSQQGLISGNFFAVYDESAAGPIDDEAVAERLRRKREEDMAKILARMEGVKVERAYRISKALEDFAKDIIQNKLPTLKESLNRWGRRVLLADLLTLGLLGGGAWAVVKFGVVPANLAWGLYGAAALSVLLLHFRYRKWFAVAELRRWREKDEKMAAAVAHNTRWYRPMLRVWLPGWSRRAAERLERVVDYSKAAIRRLNDQYVSPAGAQKSEEESLGS